MKRALVISLLALAGCRDLSGFSTAGGGSYQGAVIDAPFILAGIDGGNTSLCITIDTNHLQDTPGSIWSSDGRFQAVPLRTIPQIWQDPLSTFTFGEGRLKNLMYVARATSPYTDGNGNDVFVILSLMQAGDIEVRLLRGAPLLAADGGASPAEQNVFAVFDLNRQSGPCSF
jgi:hypothetical protein